MNKIKQTVLIIVCLAVIIPGIFTLTNPDMFIRYREDSDFEYIEEDGKIVLTKYNGECENLIIPSEIDSKPVTAIRGTFCNNVNLKNVKISDCVEIIDYMSFYGCASLVRVTVPDSVKTIGHAAFLGCISLEKIKLGSSVREIMPYAFSDCGFLKKAVLSNGLLFIGENAFLNCKRLEKLTIPASVEVIGGVTEKRGDGKSTGQKGDAGHTSFDGCDALRLQIAKENPFYSVEDGKIIRKETN